MQFQRDYTIIIKTVEVKIVDRDLIPSAHGYVYNQKLIYIDFILTRNVTDVDMKVSLDMITKDNRHMNIFKFDVNGCESLQLKHDRMNFLKVLFREIFRVSNIPRKCPFYAVSIQYSSIF